MDQKYITIQGARENNLKNISLKIPKDKTVVFICRSGGRSGNATAMAKDQGFANVYNMKGGMLLWNEMGLETEGKPS